MARRGDTKPLCHVAHASVAFHCTTVLPSLRMRGNRTRPALQHFALECCRDLSEGTLSRSSSILRCVRALTRVCSQVLIAACR